MHSPGRLLDLGCGTGTNAVYMAKRGWHVTGVDYVRTAIWEARRKARDSGVQADFYCEDVTRLRGICGAFDLVLDIGCLHSLPFPKRQAYYENLPRLLVDGGIYLLYAFVLSNQPEHVGLLDQDIALLSGRLELVERSEGSDHGSRSVWFTWRRTN